MYLMELDGWIINPTHIDYVQPYYSESDVKNKPYKLIYVMHGKQAFTQSCESERERDKVIKQLLEYKPEITIKQEMVSLTSGISTVALDTKPDEIRTDSYSLPDVTSIFK